MTASDDPNDQVVEAMRNENFKISTKDIRTHPLLRFKGHIFIFFCGSVTGSLIIVSAALFGV